MKTIRAICLALLAGLPAALSGAELDPQAPYSAPRSNPVTYDVEFSAVVTPPYHARVLKVWLPLPQSDAAQEVTEGAITTYPRQVEPRIATEPLYGNKFAYFEFREPQGAQLIRHKFKVKCWELRWKADLSKVKSVAKWPDAFAPYLRSESQAVVVGDDVRRQLAAFLPAPQRDGRDFGKVLNWVHQNLTYDHNIASLSASSQHALEKSRGHCSDYHGLCAAFGRALGYPARVTYGINPFPKNSPSHCKLEVFLPPHGWVSFDVSETQKLIKRIEADGKLTDAKKQQLVQAAVARLRSGFRDNTWFLQTRGTDYQLVPPAVKPVPVVRTIYAEADGKPLPDPDPAAAGKLEHAWMTLHKYTPDKEVTYPFEDFTSLEQK